MSTVKISSIVHIFLEDPYLLTNWIQLADSLDIPSTQIRSLRRQLNYESTTDYEVLGNILSTWKSHNGEAATVDSLCATLHDLGFINVEEKLQDLTKHLTKPVKLKERNSNSENGCNLISKQQIFYGIEDPVKSFTGRDDTLGELARLVQNSILSAVLISGLGGIGKSQLVRKYLSLHKSTIAICNWVNGESAETLRSSIEQFAAYLNVPTTNKQNDKPLELHEIVNSSLNHVKEKMTLLDKEKYIIVIDNVDDLYDDFFKVTKQLCSYSRSSVIITSRRRDLLQGESEFLELSEWTKKDAVQYVNRSLNSGKPIDPDVDLLCSTLQCYPLALSQAVAYIRYQKQISHEEDSYSIRQYLAKYESKGDSLLNKPLQISTYEKTSFVVVNLTIDKLKTHHGRIGSVAYSCLELFSLLNPVGINVKFLKRFLKLIVNENSAVLEDVEEDMTSALQLLVIYSLISIKKFITSIHRVVQKVIRIRTQRKQRSERDSSSPTKNLGSEKNYAREIEILELVLPTIHPWIDQNSKSEMVQILSIMDTTLDHGHLVAKHLKLPSEVCSQLFFLRMGKELFTFSTKFHSAMNNSIGENHPTTLAMKHAIGKSLHYLGRWDESVKLYEEVYPLIRTVLGDSHEETLNTGHNFSCLLLDLERNEEAYQILNKNYEQVVISHGKNSDKAMCTLNTKASSLKKLGRLIEVQLVLEEILQYYLNNYEKTHTRVLSTKHNIASVLYSEGKYPEARNIFREVVQEYFEKEPPDEVLAANSMYWIALCDIELGKMEKAVKNLESVLVIRKKELGEIHPHTNYTVNKIREIRAFKK